jgi:hypothetical protein
MNYLTLLQSKILPAEYGEMIKAGILSESLALTEKGERILLTILFEDNKDALSAWVKEYLTKWVDKKEESDK